MIIYAHQTDYPYILFCDIEFDQGVLVQFAGLLFKKIGDGIYQLASSCNKYISYKPSYPFTRYTGLNKDFLLENGESTVEVVQTILEEFLAEVDKSTMLVVSHGLRNDRKIMFENKLNLIYDENSLKDIPGYCTFENARVILHRNSNLKLDDLAQECGYFLDGAHNAYHDAWATVAVFCWLRKMSKKKIEYKGEQE